MKSFGKFLFAWLPPLLWMVIIFTFSSRERVVVAQDYVLNFLFFKTLHVLEYAVLYLLLFRGFYLQDKSAKGNQKYFWPLIIAVTYAVSDEIHQTFVPTREGRLRDVFIDSIGISFMYWYCKRYLNIVKRFI